MSKRVSSSATAGGTTNPASVSSSSSTTNTSARIPPRSGSINTGSGSGGSAISTAVVSLDLNRPNQSAVRSSSLTNSNEVPPSTRHLLTGNEQGGGSAQSLIDIKTEANYFHRIKKRPISGVLTSDADSELTCPICFDLIDVAHVTKCGHSFCQVCIQTALEHTHRCPKCNTPCSITKDVFPNFALNQIIEKYRDETNHKKCKLAQRQTTSGLLELLSSSQEELNIDDVNQLIQILAARKEELKFTHKKVTELLVYDFLKHLQQTKTEELNRIQYELQIVNEDCRLVEECLNSLQVEPPVSTALKRRVSSSNQLIKLDAQSINSTTSDQDQQVKQQDSEIVNSEDVSKDLVLLTQQPGSPSVQDAKIQSALNGKKRILHRYFDELSQTYINSAHNRDFKDLKSVGGSSPPPLSLPTTPSISENQAASSYSGTTKSGSVLNRIRSTVSRMTTYNQFKSIASVNYNSDMYGSSSIVSSVDFDQSYERFAMAGVTKRIKIFDFHNILDRPYGAHYPLLEMSHNAKLSCVNWNRYFRQQLACSDYDGVVTLWDADTGSLLKSYQEHEKRCWGVQFCDVDPRLLASGSDDSRVKIWSSTSDYSVMSIDAKSNVCCVAFKPDSKFHILFGTADHNIHYYDLRNCKEPVSLFKGHKKAVSYVKFSGENEFVSASTDSSLKLWRINEGQCVRSFTGHLNEKNFVGLEAKNGYVVTGSENNTVYLYCTELSKPLQTYKFEETNTNSISANKRDESTNNDFVSAVCWSNQNHLLAANSQGVVRVLELI